MMAQVTAKMIKELRERTGIAMGKCKEALVEAGGDLEKAIEVLRKAGMGAAQKKEGREAKEGTIFALIGEKNIALIEVNAETDFVVQNERFQEFVQLLAEQALKEKISSLQALLQAPFIKDPSLTVDEQRNLVIQALGENIQIRRLELIEKSEGSSYGIYSHMGGKLVVIVEIAGDKGEEVVAKDVAMHVAAESPDYVRPEEVPQDILAKEEEIARSQIRGKPENIIDKIVRGKIKAFTDQFCLVCQKYIKDPSVTVQQYVEAAGKKSGKDLSVRSFWRWKVGQ